MKIKASLFITAILLLLTVAGCTPQPGGQPTADTPQTSGEQRQTDLAPVIPKQGWPVELVPSELPEYTRGAIVNSGEDDGTVYIKIRDTDKDALGQYLDELKTAGWIVTGDSHEAKAVNGLHTIDFNWQGGGSLLQMSLHTGQAGAWPSDQIPPDILPPQTGALVDAVEILEVTENAWYFNYTYDGIDQAAARQYMELLLENGWSGGDAMITKEFEWNGQRYRADIEIYETAETRTTFTCNFYLEG